jgi:hypothetical protein
MDIHKLQFNNRTVIYPGHSGYVAFDISVEYNVTTSGNHGTVIASPNKGIDGTIVTLTNSPDSGYMFSSYTVTGATLNNNQFVINGSDVTVVGNFIQGLTLNPMNSWYIPSASKSSVSFSDTNTVKCNGIGGLKEMVYKQFTVPSSGTYTIRYDYNVPTVRFWSSSDSNKHFGLYVSPNKPGEDDFNSYTTSASNRNGPDIATSNSSPGTGSKSFTYTFTAGTNYYAWLPLSNIYDGTNYYFTFTNILITKN